MSTDESWLRLEVVVDARALLEDALFELGALGIEVQDHETFMEDGSIAPVPEGMARLIVYFPQDAPADAIRQAVEAQTSDYTLADYSDRSWETSWKAYFHPVRVSDRAVVGPPWEKFEAPDGGAAIVIEPGMAFGTGTHETTRLCADAIDRALRKREGGCTVLDVGCGSAILSMIAARLGARGVVGTDVDARALEVAAENLEKNGLGDAVELTGAPLGELGQFDLVVANILAHILLELRDELVARLAAEGTLVLSGITLAQEEDFRASFEAAGVELRERAELGDWVALTYWRS